MNDNVNKKDIDKEKIRKIIKIQQYACLTSFSVVPPPGTCRLQSAGLIVPSPKRGSSPATDPPGHAYGACGVDWAPLVSPFHDTDGT